MTHFVSTRYTRPFVSSRPNSPLRVQTWAWCWRLECISSRNYMNVIVYYIAAGYADFISVSKTKTDKLSTTAWLYIDISEDFVMRCTLPVNTGACLSPKDELAQEYLRIEHVHWIGIVASQYTALLPVRPPYLYTLYIAVMQIAVRIQVIPTIPHSIEG